MRTPAAEPLSAETFFTGAWRGEGVVRSLFNQPLRTFRLGFVGVREAQADAFLLEERVAYDFGVQMQRAWRVSADGRGGYLGLEASQAARMSVRPTRRGLRLRYDRPRAMPGPNVASVHLLARLDVQGRVHMEGWTRALGVVPLLRSSAVLSPADRDRDFPADD